MNFKINGYQNEYNFVNYLNNKKVKELHPLFKDCFEKIFENINDEDNINAWKNSLPQKADIFVKIKNEQKGISLKMGSKNSVHVSPISDFISFLIRNGVRQEIIIEYLKYHYADGTTNGTGKIRQTVEEYKTSNQNKIDLINESINKETILRKAIDKFILVGDNGNKSIDLLIYGTTNDFLWFTKEEIINTVIEKKHTYSTGVHFACLSCQPLTRCINRNPLYDRKRFCVQIKWFSLFDDIIEKRSNHFTYLEK